MRRRLVRYGSRWESSIDRGILNRLTARTILDQIRMPVPIKVIRPAAITSSENEAVHPPRDVPFARTTILSAPEDASEDSLVSEERRSLVSEQLRQW